MCLRTQYVDSSTQPEAVTRQKIPVSTPELRLQKLQACTEESCYISARSQRANGEFGLVRSTGGKFLALS